MSIRKRGPRSYQVRISPFPAQTVPTRDAAEKLELDLKTRKSLGAVYEEAPTKLGHEIDALLSRIEATRDPRPATVKFNRRSAKIWEPFRETRIPMLRRAAIEDFIAARAGEHPQSAKNELEFLKRVLKEARGRGQRVDPAIFEILPIKHQPRRGRALTVVELYELASWMPEHVSRLVLVAGQVSARQKVWFNLTDDMLGLGQGRMSIPAALAKNRQDHSIYLTPLEVSLLREQLLARPSGTAFVFPTASGKRWTESGFREGVWNPAVEAAARQDKENTGREISVFDDFTFHLLRHTACSLMAMAGMDPAVASERAGQTDGGALFLKRYRHLYEGEKRVQAGKL